MTIGQLRKLLIFSVLGLTGVTVLFFILAPLCGYPLEPDQGWGIAQISIPVFAGYLGTATQFAAGQNSQSDLEVRPMLSVLIVGPLAIYLIGGVAILLAFWMTNRPGAPIGDGISTQLLSTILTSLLGIVTVTANIAVVQLFKPPVS
jgi:hypothetical protein